MKVWKKETRPPDRQYAARAAIPIRGRRPSWRARRVKRPIVYVETKNPSADAKRLLGAFLRKAFRRPVSASEVQEYTAIVKAKLDACAAFETPMVPPIERRWCRRSFSFLREPVGKLDDHALAARLSYFLWSSLPDDELSAR